MHVWFRIKLNKVTLCEEGKVPTYLQEVSSPMVKYNKNITMQAQNVDNRSTKEHKWSTIRGSGMRWGIQPWEA